MPVAAEQGIIVELPQQDAIGTVLDAGDPLHIACIMPRSCELSTAGSLLLGLKYTGRQLRTGQSGLCQFKHRSQGFNCPPCSTVAHNRDLLFHFDIFRQMQGSTWLVVPVSSTRCVRAPKGPRRGWSSQQAAHRCTLSRPPPLWPPSWLPPSWAGCTRSSSHLRMCLAFLKCLALTSSKSSLVQLWLQMRQKLMRRQPYDTEQGAEGGQRQILSGDFQKCIAG